MAVVNAVPDGAELIQVTEVVNAGTFWTTASNSDGGTWSKPHAQLEMMELFLAKAKLTLLPKRQPPEINELVAVQHPQTEKWHRGCVKTIDVGACNYWVFLLDHGRTVKVPKSSIRDIDDHYKIQETLAFQIVIFGIVPCKFHPQSNKMIETSEWSCSANGFVKKLIAKSSKVYFCKRGEYDADKISFGEIYLVGKDGFIDLGILLCLEKYALKKDYSSWERYCKRQTLDFSNMQLPSRDELFKVSEFDDFDFGSKSLSEKDDSRHFYGRGSVSTRFKKQNPRKEDKVMVSVQPSNDRGIKKKFVINSEEERKSAMRNVQEMFVAERENKFPSSKVSTPQNTGKETEASQEFPGRTNKKIDPFEGENINVPSSSKFMDLDSVCKPHGKLYYEIPEKFVPHLPKRAGQRFIPRNDKFLTNHQLIGFKTAGEDASACPDILERDQRRKMQNNSRNIHSSNEWDIPHKSEGFFQKEYKTSPNHELSGSEMPDKFTSAKGKFQGWKTKSSIFERKISEKNVKLTKQYDFLHNPVQPKETTNQEFPVKDDATNAGRKFKSQNKDLGNKNPLLGFKSTKECEQWNFSRHRSAGRDSKKKDASLCQRVSWENETQEDFSHNERIIDMKTLTSGENRRNRKCSKGFDHEACNSFQITEEGKWSSSHDLSWENELQAQDSVHNESFARGKLKSSGKNFGNIIHSKEIESSKKYDVSCSSLETFKQESYHPNTVKSLEKETFENATYHERFMGKESKSMDKPVTESAYFENNVQENIRRVRKLQDENRFLDTHVSAYKEKNCVTSDTTFDRKPNISLKSFKNASFDESSIGSERVLDPLRSRKMPNRISHNSLENSRDGHFTQTQYVKRNTKSSPVSTFFPAGFNMAEADKVFSEIISPMTSKQKPTPKLEKEPDCVNNISPTYACQVSKKDFRNKISSVSYKSKYKLSPNVFGSSQGSKKGYSGETASLLNKKDEVSGSSSVLQMSETDLSGEATGIELQKQPMQSSEELSYTQELKLPNCSENLLSRSEQQHLDDAIISKKIGSCIASFTQTTNTSELEIEPLSREQQLLSAIQDYVSSSDSSKVDKNNSFVSLLQHFLQNFSEGKDKGKNVSSENNDIGNLEVEVSDISESMEDGDADLICATDTKEPLPKSESTFSTEAGSILRSTVMPSCIPNELQAERVIETSSMILSNVQETIEPNAVMESIISEINSQKTSTPQTSEEILMIDMKENSEVIPDAQGAEIKMFYPKEDVLPEESVLNETNSELKETVMSVSEESPVIDASMVLQEFIEDTPVKKYNLKEMKDTLDAVSEIISKEISESVTKMSVTTSEAASCSLSKNISDSFSKAFPKILVKEISNVDSKDDCDVASEKVFELSEISELSLKERTLSISKELSKMSLDDILKSPKDVSEALDQDSMVGEMAELVLPENPQSALEVVPNITKEATEEPTENECEISVITQKHLMDVVDGSLEITKMSVIEETSKISETLENLEVSSKVMTETLDTELTFKSISELSEASLKEISDVESVEIVDTVAKVLPVIELNETYKVFKSDSKGDAKILQETSELVSEVISEFVSKSCSTFTNLHSKAIQSAMSQDKTNECCLLPESQQSTLNKYETVPVVSDAEQPFQIPASSEGNVEMKREFLKDERTHENKCKSADRPMVQMESKIDVMQHRMINMDSDPSPNIILDIGKKIMDELGRTVVLLHGAPNNSLKAVVDAEFRRDIHEVLKTMMTRLMSLQKYAWPLIQQGRSIVLVGPQRSGKTLGFVVPLLDLVLQNVSSNQVPKGNGPVLLILCSGSKSCNEIQELCYRFLKNATKVPNEVKMLVAYGGGAEKIECKLVNGCHILISTPRCFKRLLALGKVVVNFLRLKYFVLDEADILTLRFLPEVELICKRMECEMRPQDKAELQVIATAEKWCPGLEGLVHSIPKPAVCIAAFLEALVYGHLEPHVHFVNSDSRINVICDIIEETAKDHRTIVICREVAEVKMVYDALMPFPQMMVMHEGMDFSEIHDINKKWEAAVNPVLICTDVLQRELRFQTASQLVHFSLSNISKKDFALRCSALTSVLPSIFSSEAEKAAMIQPQMHILISDSDSEPLPVLTRLLKRLGVTVDPDLQKRANIAEIEKEMKKDDFPLCYNTKAFGDCWNRSRCIFRHIISKEDKPRNVPENGTVKVKILYVHDACNYSARILEHVSESGKVTVIPYLLMSVTRKLHSYFKDEEHRILLDNPKANVICATEKSSGVFHRVEILAVTNKTLDNRPSQVLVQFIDDGCRDLVKTEKLFVLPEELKEIPPQSVELYLCRLIPCDLDWSWGIITSEKVASILSESEHKGRFLVGKIKLSLGHTLWLDPLECFQSLPTLKTSTIIFSLRRKLLDEQLAVENPKHMSLLYEACSRGGLDVIHSSNSGCSTRNDRSEEKIEACWAHLPFEEFSLVYFVIGDHPGRFYVRQQKFEDLVHKLDKKLNNIAKNKNSIDRALFTGDFCIGRFPTDDRWYRARIESAQDDNVDLFFVDHGDRATVSRSEAIPLPKDLITNLPFQAIECCFAGVSPDLGDRWSEKSIAAMFDITFKPGSADEGKLLYAKVLDKVKPADCTGGYKYHVALIDVTPHGCAVLNNTLVAWGLASQNDGQKELLQGINTEQLTPPIDLDPSEDEYEDLDKDLEEPQSFNDAEITFEEDLNNEDAESSQCLPPADVGTSTPNTSINTETSLENSFLNFDINAVTEDEIMEFLEKAKEDYEAHECKTSVEPSTSSGVVEKKGEMNMEESTGSIDVHDISDTSNGGRQQAECAKHEELMDNQNIEHACESMHSLRDEHENTNFTSGNDFPMPALGPITRVPLIYWRQDPYCVRLRIDLPGVENYYLKWDIENLHFWTVVDELIYSFDIHLFGPINPEMLIHKGGLFVHIKMQKIMVGFEWLRLTVDPKKLPWIRRDYEAEYDNDLEDLQISEQLRVMKEMEKKKDTCRGGLLPADEAPYEDDDDDRSSCSSDMVLGDEQYDPYDPLN